VFWTPPTSGLSSSGHRRDRHGAELRGERADPEPDEEHRHEDDLGPGVRVEPGEQHDRAAEQREWADAHDQAGRGAREDARDADGGREQGHREGQETGARLEGGQAERHRQEEGHDEEEPGLDEELEEEHRQPAGQLPVAEHGRAHERLLAPRLQAGLPAEEDPDHEQPRQHQPHRGRRARPRRTVGLGLDPAPLAGAQDAEDESAEAERRQHGPDHVQLRAPPPARPRSAAS
jgi:hypothetical protein